MGWDGRSDRVSKSIGAVDHDGANNVGAFRAHAHVEDLRDVDSPERRGVGTAAAGAHVDHGNLGNAQHLGDLSNQSLRGDGPRTAAAIIDVVQAAVVGSREGSCISRVDEAVDGQWGVPSLSVQVASKSTHMTLGRLELLEIHVKSELREVSWRLRTWSGEPVTVVATRAATAAMA